MCAVDQQRLYVGVQGRKQRVSPRDLLPGGQLETRLGGTHGTRIEGHHALDRRAVEEEGHVHRNAQLLPGDVGKHEVVEAEAAIGNQTVMPGAGRAPVKQQRAGAAGTQELPRLKVDQMAVLGLQRRTAKLTALLLLDRRRCGIHIPLPMGNPSQPRRGEPA